MKIGVDLGGTNIRAGLVDEVHLLGTKKVLLQNKDNVDDTLDQLKSLIRSVWVPEVQGIGLGVPSVVDMERGIVYDVVNIPSWKEVPLKDILEDTFGVPVFINNDVNCFVLGEKYYGHGKNFQSVVGIAMGTGVGAGVITDGRLYAGANCGAGEVGYLPYLDYDFEQYCSSNFFSHFHNTTALQAYEKAKLNDARALSLWAEFGHHVGILLRSVMYAYDPEAVILGGSIASAYPYFEPALREAMSDTYFPGSVKKLQILCSEVEHVSILGAAALVDHYLELAMR